MYWKLSLAFNPVCGRRPTQTNIVLKNWFENEQLEMRYSYRAQHSLIIALEQGYLLEWKEWEIKIRAFSSQPHLTVWHSRALAWSNACTLHYALRGLDWERWWILKILWRFSIPLDFAPLHSGLLSVQGLFIHDVHIFLNVLTPSSAHNSFCVQIWW